jgi:integrase
MVYKGRRVKTGQEFTTVLLRPALEILKRYKNKLPIISNVKYNLYLKAAVKYAKIDKPVSTHWARHTGATILLNEGNVPMHIVQHILGHATIRETERTYAKVLDRSIVESVSKYGKRKFG